MSPSPPELPPDILFLILEHTPLTGILKWNLSCRAFANVGRSQLFTTVTLRNLQRAESLAQLVDHNKTLLNATLHFCVGVRAHARNDQMRRRSYFNRGGDGLEAQNAVAVNALWDWLDSPAGRDVVRSLKSVQHLTFWVVARNPTVQVLDHFAESCPALRSTSYWDGDFGYSPFPAAITQILHRAVSFDMDCKLVPQNAAAHRTRAQRPPGRLNAVSSLTLRNKNAATPTHAGALLTMIKASGLQYLQSLTIWLIDIPRLQQLADVLEHFSGTLESLTLDHVPWSPPPLPVFAFKPMKKLTRLRVRWFCASVTSRLAGAFALMMSPSTAVNKLVLYPTLASSTLSGDAANQYRLSEWDDLAAHLKDIILVVYVTHSCPMKEVLLAMSTEDMAGAILPQAHARSHITNCEVRLSEISNLEGGPPTNMTSGCIQLEKYEGEERDSDHGYHGLNGS